MGQVTAPKKDSLAVTSPVARLPATWLGRARELQSMLSGLAHARADEAAKYARVYLAAQGNAEQRTQAARLATAEAHLAAELAAAKVAAYKLMLDSDTRPAGQARGGDLGGALWSVMARHQVTCRDAPALIEEVAAIFDAYATGDSGRITSLRRGQLEQMNGDPQ
jgi:hypothetical protein